MQRDVSLVAAKPQAPDMRDCQGRLYSSRLGLIGSTTSGNCCICFREKQDAGKLPLSPRRSRRTRVPGDAKARDEFAALA